MAFRRIDLVGRKLAMSGGAAARREIEDMRAIARESDYAALAEAVEALAQASDFMARAMKETPAQGLAGATPYLRLFALARGGDIAGERRASWRVMRMIRTLIAMRRYRISSRRTSPSRRRGSRAW